MNSIYEKRKDLKLCFFLTVHIKYILMFANISLLFNYLNQIKICSFKQIIAMKFDI
jgi:hypothetical protein